MLRKEGDVDFEIHTSKYLVNEQSAILLAMDVMLAVDASKLREGQVASARSPTKTAGRTLPIRNIDGGRGAIKPFESRSVKM